MASLKNTISILVALFVALVPWQTRLIWHEAFLNGVVWEYGRYSLYATQFLLLCIIVLYVAWLYRQGLPSSWQPKRLVGAVRQPYTVMVLLLLWVFLSCTWAVDAELALVYAVMMLSSGVLASCIIVVGVPLRSIAYGWVGGALVQSFFAISQFFVQYVPAQKWLGLAVHAANIPGAIVLQTDTERWLRAYGSFPHPNMLGGYLAIALLCVAYLSYQYSSWRSRVITALVTAMLSTGLFFSFSRSAWLALVVANGWFILYAIRNRRRVSFLPLIRFMIVGGTVGLFLVYSYWPLVNSRVTIDSYLEYASLRERVVYIDQALTLMSHHPMVGQGIGNYTIGVYTSINTHIPGWLYQPVHNVFLLVWSELGFVGFGLFAVLLSIISFKNISRTTLESTASLALLSVVITISFFDHYWWTLYSGVALFWVVISLAMAYSQGRN